MKSFRRIVLAVVCTSWGLAHSVQLGAIGPTYAIAEESALDMILKKLQKAQQSGELKKLQQEAVKRSLASVRNMCVVTTTLVGLSSTSRIGFSERNCITVGLTIMGLVVAAGLDIASK